ncbi:MAG: hypothetical protein ACFFEE_09255, partial [Candidatus Thorarchaeota archaeon]
IKSSDDPLSNLEQYIGFLETLTTHLQAVVSLSREMSMTLRAAQEEKSHPISNLQEPSHFVFNVLSKEDARYWNTELCKFLVQLEGNLAQKDGVSASKQEQTYIVFSGVLPIYKSHR